MKYGMITALLPVVLAFQAGCQKSTVEGPRNEKLTLLKPSAVTIERGRTEKVMVNIQRQNVTGPVAVNFENLPDGVKIEQNGRNIEGDSATFVLEADDSADLVTNHAARVTIKGPDGMAVAETFDVTVREKS